MAPTGGPPPGWYRDPAGGGGQRWWDGTAWTNHSVPGPPLDDEETPARWARIALLVAIPAQVAGDALLRSSFRRIIVDPPDLSDPSYHFTLFGRWAAVAMQVFGAVGTITGVVFLIWFARSAHNARLIGLPARRSPAAAVAGFIVPVINLWWPYQSTCDLLPDDGNPDTRRLVLRWFLLWIVGGFVGTATVFASAFIGSSAGWILLVVPTGLVTAAGLAARQVVATVVDAHGGLARA